MMQSSPDIDLLVACLEFGVAREEVTRLETYGASDMRFGAAVDNLDRAAESVTGLRALTVEGLRTKAIVCRFVLEAEEPDVAVNPPNGVILRHDALSWSLLADLLAYTQSSSDINPDTELLAVCAGFDATEHHRTAMFNDGSLTKEINAMLQAEQDRRMEKICALRALTSRGWQARARSLLLIDKNILERDPVHANDRMINAILRDLVDGYLAEPSGIRLPGDASCEPAPCDSGPSTLR